MFCGIIASNLRIKNLSVVEVALIEGVCEKTIRNHIEGRGHP